MADIAAEASLPALTGALAQPPAGGAGEELESIIREFYDKLERHRTGIRLVDRCAASHPELAEIWFEVGRRGSLALFTDYIADRTELGRCAAPRCPSRSPGYLPHTYRCQKTSASTERDSTR